MDSDTSTVVLVIGFATMLVQQAVSMYTTARNHKWDVDDRKSKYEWANEDRNTKAFEAQKAVDSQTSEIKHLVTAVGEKASAELQEVAATVATAQLHNRRKDDPKPV